MNAPRKSNIILTISKPIKKEINTKLLHTVTIEFELLAIATDREQLVIAKDHLVAFIAAEK